MPLDSRSASDATSPLSSSPEPGKRAAVRPGNCYSVPVTTPRKDGLPAAPREITYLGRPFLYPSGSLIGEHFLENGVEWDPVLKRVLPTLLPGREPVVVEVGANIGASTAQILAARPDAKLYLFEPSERFRPFLLENLRLRDAEAKVYPWAAGRSVGTLTLHNNASTATTGREEDYGAGDVLSTQEIPVVTLDGLPLSRCDFLKVDVDGPEFEVLRGGEGILRNLKPLLFFEFATYLMEDPKEGLAWLASLGYRRFFCLNPVGGFVGSTGEPRQAVEWAKAEESRYVDILCCYAESEQEARLASVLKYM